VRTVFSGAEIFDGTGAAPAAADVAVEDGRIIDVGPGLDAVRVALFDDIAIRRSAAQSAR